MINKFLKNDYTFSVITKIIMVIVTFLHSIVLARFLGPDLKGIHATILSIISIGSVVINMSCQQAYPHFRKKYGYQTYFPKFMSFTLIYHIFFFILTLLITLIYKLPFIAKIAMILIPLSGFSTVSGYICLVENPRQRNIALLIIEIIDTIIVCILLIYKNATNIHIFLILLIPIILKILYFNYKNKFKFDKNCFNKHFIKELVQFSLFPMITMLLTILNYKIDILMLKSSEYISIAEIGIYSIGVSLADKAVYIPDAVKEILLSKLAKGKDAHEVALTMRYCFPISILITIVIIIIGEPFINVLYGKEYTGAYAITLICVFGTSMMVFFKMITQYNNVNAKQIINVLFLMITVITNIILNSILIPKYQSLGAAIASLISYTLCAIIFVIYFSKQTKIAIKDIVFINKNDISKIKNLIFSKQK